MQMFWLWLYGIIGAVSLVLSPYFAYSGDYWRMLFSAVLGASAAAWVILTIRKLRRGK
jgi:hypothetical protein